MGYLPLSFTNIKIGIEFFFRAVLNLGRNIAAVGEFYVKNILPWAHIVKNNILSRSAALRKNPKNSIHTARMDGDGATCNFLSHNVSGRNYYGFGLRFCKYYLRNNQKLKLKFRFWHHQMAFRIVLAFETY